VNFQEFSLDPRLVAAIRAVGYTTPTPIQEQAIPIALQGRDLLGLAQTGTGKTAAFVLPILNRLIRSQGSRVRALIVAPTRELAEQTHETLRDLGRNTRLRSLTVYGGVSKVNQVAALRRGADVVVACPGRLLDLLGEGNIDLSGIEVLVLDEADRMCDMGFLPDIRRILKVLPRKRQTLFFAATMPDDIRKLADDILDHPVTVQVGIIAPAATVSHGLYPVPDGLKKSLLLAMLRQPAMERVLVFTRTKHRARSLARDLAKQGYAAAALQGNMSQNARQAALNGFRDGTYPILVATDVAARGIDVLEISHVINFDLPDTVDAYIHRIGRTGRAALTGKAYSFAAPADEGMVRDIEKVLGARIERLRLPGFDYSGSLPLQQPQAPKPVERASPRPPANRPNSRPARGRQERRSRPAW
jgi:ATP-dependent RNA helicase RhlE